MHLNKDKSPGPDGIQTVIIKSIVHLFTAPLQKLFCLPVNEEKYLQDLTIETVVAIQEG